MKKLLCVLSLIIVSIFSFCGCANIEFFRAIDANNLIVDKLVITLDQSKIDKSGKITFYELKEKVMSDANNFRDYVYDWMDSFKNEYPEIYIDVKENNGIFIEVSNDVKPNQISITIQYAGIRMFGLFYGIIPADDNNYITAMEDIGPFVADMYNQEYETEMGLFLYKYSMLKDIGLNNKIRDYSVDGIGTNYYEKYHNLTNYTLEDANVTEVFAYPDDRIYSNADDKEVVENMTFLSWNLSDKGDDFKMEIYKYAPKTISWYIAGLIISAGVVIVLFFVIRKKSKNNILIKVSKQEVEKDER